ncbi:ATP-grasp domain-containing protein [Paraburkholderia acidisoli]|uniref:Glutathione synthase/RimK-type ligase-like ATP-grasp enzyme n=1 Tax=Paraburkholderia acidisoli TaxID=2571748 RepID=A0A7Z2JHF4_9BURK|nr:hypothetical protein [Paraburkholderia acidisoli]QGZ65677.1 hypothetical protein FAZ98_28490 [Paraburkholderia acidisoli]
MATNGSDMSGLGERLLDYVRKHYAPEALLDLSLVLELKFERASALAVQQLAIETKRLYRLDAENTTPGRVKLLVLKAHGDLMTNTPFECLVEHSELEIDVLYVDATLDLNGRLPPHDVLLVAPCALDQNRAVLASLAAQLPQLSAAVINRPERIPYTSREAAWSLLREEAGICVAHTQRVGRAELAAHASVSSTDCVAGIAFPAIIRPVGSHAGRELERIADSGELRAYLNKSASDAFYVASFIDYRSRDGLYRKYRVALIDGQAHISHMGISQHWMVHYPYEEMISHPERRSEEAAFMAAFQQDFARRHSNALARVAELTGLDYVGLDCAESPDGRLVIFELATAMVVHDMDDPEMFPYKSPQMRKYFDAFCAMVTRKAREGREGRVEP